MTRRETIVEEKRLTLLARRALRYLNVKAAPPAVFLLPDAEMRRLKAKFLGRRVGPGRADVLAFPEPARFPHPESRRQLLGEICVNDNLKGGSRERRSFLVLHGLLHLLGYTHAGKSDILKMQKLERQLAKKFLRQWHQA